MRLKYSLQEVLFNSFIYHFCTKIFLIKFITNLKWMFTLSSRHQSHFLSALNNIRAPSLSYQPTVLKISFIAWETMGEVMKCYQTQPPYSSASKFTFKFHAICSPKYSMSVEPTLHKFTFVSNILKCNNQLLMSG